MTIAGRHDTSDPIFICFCFYRYLDTATGIMSNFFCHHQQFLALVTTAVNKFIKVIKDFFNPKKNCMSAA